MHSQYGYIKVDKSLPVAPMKKRIYLFLSFLTLIFLCHLSASAQNYANVKVDDLSDAQIRQMIQRAESVGYSDAQLEQAAAAQGMKAEEIQKLRTRVEKIRKESATTDNGQSNTDINSDGAVRKYNNPDKDKSDSLVK